MSLLIWAKARFSLCASLWLPRKMLW